MRVPVLFCFLAVTLAQAQVSPGFELKESVQNSGGNPANGIIQTSASYRISLDAIGDAASSSRMSSASFRMGGGFVAAYPAPQEVRNLRFVNAQGLTWDVEPSAGSYNSYRGPLSTLAGEGYGVCLAVDLPDVLLTDAGIPAAAEGYFYLITSQNLLDEEGTKGFTSNGIERGNAAPCP
jgi:hypothetical protein